MNSVKNVCVSSSKGSSGYSFKTLIAAPNQCPNSPINMYISPPGLSDDMVNAFLRVE